MNDNIDIKFSNELIDYEESLNFMEKRVIDILKKKEKDLIWFLNHNHIYTMGMSSKNNEVLSKINIPLIKSNRGGKITYHGPGQRIVYFIINLQNRKKDIRKFVSLIENTTIELLNEFDIEAKTFPDRIGIWVIRNKKIKLPKEKKIGAIGLRVKKWITYHGMSFNLNPNLNYYSKINACGLSNYSSTSMKSLGVDLSQENFDYLFLKFFLKKLENL